MKIHGSAAPHHSRGSSIFPAFVTLLLGAFALQLSTAALPAAADTVAAGIDVDALPFSADFGPMKVPVDNPQGIEKVQLGRQLFFDARLSADGSRSCYSCHRNEDGNGGHDPTAIGANGKHLTRHSPIIWNVGYLPRLYWDGRADSLEAQGKAAWAGGNMGVGTENLEAKADEIGAIPDYAKQFEVVFPKEGATPDTIIKAISAYERTLVCDNTDFDRYARGDKKALRDVQKRGLALFVGKAGCTACHTPPFFSSAYIMPEGSYYNTGIGVKGKKESEVDIGRMKVTNDESDWAAFKVPTLRNITRSAPYFHDGSVATLEAAVRFMAGGGYPNKNRSDLLSDKHLSDSEIGEIVAFLGALDCKQKLDEPTIP
jgi:cytochrome c peroxidase